MTTSVRDKKLDETRYETYAYYVVSGDFDPDHISRESGFPRQEYSHKIGDLNQRKNLCWTEASWTLMSTLNRQHHIEDHIRDVLRQLDTKEDLFRELSRTYDAGMQFVGHYDGYPGIHFETDIVQGLAKYGLWIDFDLYF